MKKWLVTSLALFQAAVERGNIMDSISEQLLKIVPADKDIVIVCVGTDRSTGDSYGPLVGTKLEATNVPFPVYGTLRNPIHAVNLSTEIREIEKEHSDKFLIALDSCLSDFSRVGVIEAKMKPLRPGAGVGKHLPSIGHAHIAAVVNVGGFMEYHTLQNTRLSMVMDLVDRTVEGIVNFHEMRSVKQVAAALD